MKDKLRRLQQSRRFLYVPLWGGVIFVALLWTQAPEDWFAFFSAEFFLAGAMYFVYISGLVLRAREAEIAAYEEAKAATLVIQQEMETIIASVIRGKDGD